MQKSKNAKKYWESLIKVAGYIKLSQIIIDLSGNLSHGS
jgi:hypothetical protein